MWFSVVPALPAEPQPPPILCWIIEKSLKKQKYINNKHLASVKVFHSRWLNPPWDSRGTTTMCKLRVTFAWTFKSMETRQKHNVKQKTDKHKLRLYHQRVVQKLRFFFSFSDEITVSGRGQMIIITYLRFNESWQDGNGLFKGAGRGRILLI